MGEIMRAIPFDQLMGWAMEELTQQDAVFGVKREKFYRNQSGTRLRLFGDDISGVVGPAAGPHTQLAQNIVAAYLAGARFMELKTVQLMDGEALRNAVPRPCINADDEGYNVEWSTELTVEGAFAEYVKAWFAIHVLMAELEISDRRDFLFNMSVGYDLEGIRSPKVDGFIEGMKDASQTKIWQDCRAYLQEALPGFRRFNEGALAEISPAVAPAVTLSTLHGCPPAEIERIAMYLLTEKKVHTYIKCNPTLLGYAHARRLLDEMGYDYIGFDDHHFKNDLQFDDAVPMLQRLQAAAKAERKDFGVKITNTFPVQNDGSKLPGEEMYLSGRALFPLSVHVAQRLSEAFRGQLPISYSGGADAFNIEALAATGIRPITVATTLLKPGGYGRFKQLAEITEGKLGDRGTPIDCGQLNRLAETVAGRRRHRKEARNPKPVKTDSKLPLFDCFKAPCKEGGCPIGQQIPQYMHLLGRGDAAGAFRVIAIDNALPSVTGALCDHNCQSKCTRNDYEDPVQIRGAKWMAAESAQEDFIKAMRPVPLGTKERTVVIGAGPAGIAVSLFLRRNGMAVTVLEKREKPFGIVSHVIPEFRIPGAATGRDFRMAVAAGVDFRFGVSQDYDVAALKKAYSYVVLATGAWKKGICPVKEGGDRLMDALDFLEKAKGAEDRPLNLGKRVAVIGAGDVAMDCARAAKRIPGVEEAVIVYRRTKAFMPALPEEISLAEGDGVRIRELLAPVRYDGRTLTCEVQELTEERDASGRRLMRGTGETEQLAFDTVIGAVGARVDTSLFAENGLALNSRNLPLVNEENQSSLKQVYLAGDCKAGASTIVNAIADAKAVAKSILARAGLAHDFVRVEVPVPDKEIEARKAVLKDAREKGRCLSCDQICEICTEVCPNRANVSIKINRRAFAKDRQILHLDGMCNECGNCGSFCPHAGNPYQDKLTLFWTKADFEDSRNVGFLQISPEEYLVRREDGTQTLYRPGQGGEVSAEIAAMIQVVARDYPYYLVRT